MKEMFFLQKVAAHRNFWLIVSLTAGLLFPAGALALRQWLPLFLGLLMTVSFAGFSLSSLLPLQTLPRRLLGPFLINYLLFGFVLMGLAALFVGSDKDLLKGFLFIALAPPGIVIVPFALMLRGDADLASTGVIGGYLAFIVFFPLAVVVFWGGELHIMSEVIKMVVFVILLPLLVSRPLRRGGIGRWLLPRRGWLIDAGFAIIVYIIVGLNQNAFTTSIATLLKPMLILALVLFGGGLIYERVQLHLQLPDAERISNALLFSVKNTGFAAVTSVALAGERAAIPSAALSVVLLVYLLIFSLRKSGA
jgi:predicted Na+-dependent transporter